MKGLRVVIVTLVIALIAMLGVGACAPAEKLKPAEFRITDLTITSSEVRVGETATVSVLITNVGEELGTHDVELIVEGTVEERKSITLQGGESGKISFSVRREEPGSYNMKIANLSSTIEVKWAPPTLTYNVGDAPTIPIYDPKEYETKPSANAYCEPGYSFSLVWTLHYAFEGAGGLAMVSLKNEGNNALFIYEVGMAGDWMAEEWWYPKDVGFTVEPNEVQDLGLITFKGPPTAGKHGIQFGAAILAKTGEGEWYDYGTRFVDPVIYDFEELAQERKVEYNESEYHDFKVL